MISRFNAIRYAIVTIGFLIIFVGAVGIILGSQFRTYGIIATSLSPLIFGLSTRSTEKKNYSDSSGNIFVIKYRRFIATWPVGLAVIFSLIGSFYMLHLDSYTDDGSVFVVYFFSISVIFAMAYWVYLSGWGTKT